MLHDEICRRLGQYDKFERAPAPPPAAKPSRDGVQHEKRMEIAVHEAAHCVGLLLCGHEIVEAVIARQDGLVGRVRERFKKWTTYPAPESIEAILEAAVSFVGATAVTAAFGFEPPTSDADFHRLGATTDLGKFANFAAAVTRFDEKKTATLRANAIAAARAICRIHGRAIDVVADALYVHGALGHDAIVDILDEEAPDEADKLLGPPESVEARASSPAPATLARVREQTFHRRDGYIGGR